MSVFDLNRFKRMEVHDVVAESSRYSLAAQESTMEGDAEPTAASE